MKFIGLTRKKILWTVLLLSRSVHVFGASATDFQCSSEPTDQHRLKVFAMDFSLAEKKIENLVVTTEVLHRYDSVSPFVFQKKKLNANVQGETLTIRIKGRLAVSLRKMEESLYQGTLTLFQPEAKVSFSCWQKGIVPKFRYDSESGRCVNADDQDGMNKWRIEQVRSLRQGECVDLGGVDLGEHDYSYPSLRWNLKGANLDSANLFFADLVNSSFHGAKMTDLEFGYANISGKFDRHTVFPRYGCKVGRDRFNCSQ